ncbi:hypothetical protein BDZ85DRAFT_80888 [Elsinoe ampelina]|uniref:Uncharacterized protein n=1 Tax=Elsinoe ampelina TaxID=302913 RepID=A0A6A6FZ93_9PEZI|nr:hypothetical protein BDZ85DRAFT_80888 [Elsinoe ampelina]
MLLLSRLYASFKAAWWVNEHTCRAHHQEPRLKSNAWCAEKLVTEVWDVMPWRWLSFASESGNASISSLGRVHVRRASFHCIRLPSVATSKGIQSQRLALIDLGIRPCGCPRVYVHGGCNLGGCMRLRPKVVQGFSGHTTYREGDMDASHDE